MESTPVEDAVKTVEKTMNLEYYINLVDKTVAGFERINSNFERNSTVGKMLIKQHWCYREIICEMKTHLIQQILLLSYFDTKLPKPPQPSATTTLVSQ